MATVTTTTVLDSLRYPSESMVDRRKSDGALYFLKRTGSTSLDLFWSTNAGASWTDLSVNITRTGLQQTSGLFIDGDGIIHMLYRVYESGEDRVYYRRRDPNVGPWDSERLVTSATAASAGSVYTGLSVVAFELNSVTYVFYAVGTRDGSNSGVTLFAATISSSGTWTLKNTLIDGFRQWLNGPDGVVNPALDFKHTGDAKSVGSGPALWLVWGRSTTYCIKASWTSGPNWYGPWTPTTVATGLTNQDHNVGRYNGYGDKFNIVIPNGSAVSVIERNVSDSGGTTRTSGVHPQGVVRYAAISNSSSSNSYRVFAVGTTTNDLYYVDYSSSSGTWGSWTQVSATDIVGTVPNNFSVRRNNYGNGQYDLVISGGTSPYTIQHTASTAASAPHTPTITTPSNGEAKDVAQSLTITWTFSDDDPLDTQQAYALKRVIGGSTVYWNNGTSTWQASEVYNVSGTSSKTLSAGWGADADAPHSYSVKVRDQSLLTSASYSAAVQVIPTAKINPTITSPGASVTVPALTATWTVSSQSAFRAVLEEGGIELYDSGWVSSTSTSHAIPTVLESGHSYTFKLTTRNAEGLDSDEVSQAFTVTLTPPPAPTSVTLLPSPIEGGIYVGIVNADTTGSQPEPVSQDIYRREVGDTSEGIRIASALAVTDRLNQVPTNTAGIETSAAGWTANANCTLARSSTQALDGTYSLECTVTPAGAPSFYSAINSIQITGGRTYRTSLMSKLGVSGISPSGWRIEMYWREADGTTYVGGMVQTATFNVTAAGWTEIYLDWTAPATAAYAEIVMRGQFAHNLNDKIYFDRISILETNNPVVPVSHLDFQVASAVEYEYRVLVRGVNGTSVYSDWIS
jgi:hypothetical protein